MVMCVCEFYFVSSIVNDSVYACLCVLLEVCRPVIVECYCVCVCVRVRASVSVLGSGAGISRGRTCRGRPSISRLKCAPVGGQSACTPSHRARARLGGRLRHLCFQHRSS